MLTEVVGLVHELVTEMMRFENVDLRVQAGAGLGRCVTKTWARRWSAGVIDCRTGRRALCCRRAWASRETLIHNSRAMHERNFFPGI